MVVQFAAPQRPDHPDGLLQHLEAHLGDGHRSPKMCSFSASPVPTPSPKRPSSSSALVAAAWATTAGWIRTVGQVTAVVTGSARRRDRPDHRPDERALALLVVPRVEVVGDPQGVETASRPPPDRSTGGRVLLGRQEIPNLHASVSFPMRLPGQTRSRSPAPWATNVNRGKISETVANSNADHQPQPGSPRALRRTTTMMSTKAAAAATANSTPNRTYGQEQRRPRRADHQPEAGQHQAQREGTLRRWRAAETS